MALTQRLDLRQSQALVMTPQLQQAIKLLQLSGLELAAFVEEQIELNPLLERGEPDEPIGASERPDPLPESGTADLDRAVGEGGADTAAELDASYDAVWGEDGPSEAGAFSGASGGSQSFDDSDVNFEEIVGGRTSLREHLSDQLSLDVADPTDRLIGLQLIDGLDEAGYLRTPLEEVAGSLGCDLARVEAVLARVQRFDPAGIFARSLKECLALQLADRNRLDPAMTALLDHLDLVAQRNFRALMTVCGVDAEDLAEMLDEVRRLDPKPALAYDDQPIQPVVPDILVRRDAEGGWTVEMNPESLPRLLVDGRYYARVRKGARSREEREYITEQYNAANWLVKSLHQRATTVLKVATEIVQRQDAFFHHGVEHLRPLILRDVADAIDMHESTVSRVTSNKYMATPRGLFELKYFFTTAIASSRGGEAHSAEAVRYRIKTLIDQEETEAVLSDDRIVEMLRATGIDIARRTVAKYREAMRIPSSVQRRREKAAQNWRAAAGE